MYSFSRERIEKEARYGNVTPNGVVFVDELASIDGCNFYLIKTPETTQKQIAEAKRWLRQNRDVVKFYIAKIRED